MLEFLTAKTPPFSCHHWRSGPSSFIMLYMCSTSDGKKQDGSLGSNDLLLSTRSHQTPTSFAFWTFFCFSAEPFPPVNQSKTSSMWYATISAKSPGPFSARFQSIPASLEKAFLSCCSRNFVIAMSCSTFFLSLSDIDAISQL